MNSNQELIQEKDVTIETTTVENEITTKKKQTEFFTDEMHWNIYTFQDSYKGGASKSFSKTSKE